MLWARALQSNIDFLDCFNNLKSTPVIFNYSPPHAFKPIHFLTEVTILRTNSSVHLKLFYSAYPQTSNSNIET